MIAVLTSFNGEDLCVRLQESRLSNLRVVVARLREPLVQPYGAFSWRKRLAARHEAARTRVLYVSAINMATAGRV